MPPARGDTGRTGGLGATINSSYEEEKIEDEENGLRQPLLQQRDGGADAVADSQGGVYSADGKTHVADKEAKAAAKPAPLSDLFFFADKV